MSGVIKSRGCIHYQNVDTLVLTAAACQGNTSYTRNSRYGRRLLIICLSGKSFDLAASPRPDHIMDKTHYLQKGQRSTEVSKKDGREGFWTFHAGFLGQPEAKLCSAHLPRCRQGSLALAWSCIFLSYFRGKAEFSPPAL